MPRIASDYSKTIMYVLVCRNPDIKELYVGHTTNFTKRKNGHKTNCINPNRAGHHYYVYQFIRENGGWENWDMILLETYNCESNIQACKREREWFEILQPSLNKWLPCVSSEEKSITQRSNYKLWYDKNKDYFKLYHQNKKSNAI